MFVYGVRCAPIDLVNLEDTANVDYYMDYGLVVFPEFTKPSAYVAQSGLTSLFWNRVKHVLERPFQVQWVDLEEPYLTTGQETLVQSLRNYYPTLQSGWYYVPKGGVGVGVEEELSELTLNDQE